MAAQNCAAMFLFKERTMAEAFEVTAEIPASPELIYTAWLDGKLHTAMTGAGAEVDPVVGGKHSAWDGYIWGVNLEMEAGKRFVQSWRTTEFPEEAEDSRVEVRLISVDEHTEVTLVHTNIPDGQELLMNRAGTTIILSR